MSSETMAKAIGFIGLGSEQFSLLIWAGLNLRRRIPTSTQLCIFDVVPERLVNFADAVSTHGLGDIVICKSAREVGIQPDITFSAVPEGKHVCEVYLDEAHGILIGPIDGKTFVDCSTIDPATSRAICDAVSKSSVSAHFYDAPVSGGVHEAEAGTLSFLAGASEEDAHFKQFVRPPLEMISRNIFCIGAQSQGLVVKLRNNYLSGICAIATAEAMNIGIRHGIDKPFLSEVFKNSTGGNWQNANMNPVPGVCPDAVTSKGYEGGFKVQMMGKDFNLALATAREVDAKLALGDSALVAAYKATAKDPRCKDLDNRVVYRWLGGNE